MTTDKRAVLEFKLSLRQPICLERVALSHGWYEIPPFAWDPGEKMLAVAVSGPRGGVSRLEIRQHGSRAGRVGRTLQLRWICASPRAPEPLVKAGRALACRVLNLDRDLGPFYALCKQHKPLQWVPGAGAGRVIRGPTVFSDVIATICGTNIQWKQAVKCVRQLGTLAPRAPGGELRRFPTPAELLEAGETHLREVGRVGYRAGSILAVSDAVASGELDLEAEVAACETGADLRAFFRSLPGIGPVSARYLSVLYGFTDSLAVDSLVVRYIGDKYLGGRRATEAEVQAIYARFGDLKALAYWFELLGDVDPITWRGWETSKSAPV